MKSPKETTLLVVDDEADLRSASLLTSRGKAITCLPLKTEEALKSLKHAGRHLISDIRMPGRDGIELSTG